MDGGEETPCFGFCHLNETLIFMSKFSMEAFLKIYCELVFQIKEGTSFYIMSQKDQHFWKKLTFDISKFKFQNGLKQKTFFCFFDTNGYLGAKP